jgi:PAS domain S-box-containing protein
MIGALSVQLYAIEADNGTGVRRALFAAAIGRPGRRVRRRVTPKYRRHGTSSAVSLRVQPSARQPGPGSPLPQGSVDSATGRSTAERQAAWARGRTSFGRRGSEICAPDVADIDPSLIYSLVAENVRDYAIFLMDVDGVIRCWGESARLMKWWTKEQAEGAHLRLLYPEGGAEDGTAEAHLANAAATGEYNGEGHRVRSDGSLFWAYVTLTALRDASGRLVGFTKVARDFSARRSVETALAEERHAPPETRAVAAEGARLKQLVANLSHELRTPVNAMVGSVALLEEQLAAHPIERIHIDRLQRSSRHLLTILDDVLELARAESGHLTLDTAAERLGPVVEDALADVETQAAARQVKVTNAVSASAGELPYWGDSNRVRQIVVNLLTNAVKFSDPRGEVTISGGTGESVAGAVLSGQGPWLYLRVEDTGRGIPADRLESIFEPFQQSEAGDQRQGTGLGLAISRQLARLMGGDLTVQSEVGRGSRLTLWLPLTTSDSVPR